MMLRSVLNVVLRFMQFGKVSVQNDEKTNVLRQNAKSDMKKNASGFPEVAQS